MSPEELKTLRRQLRMSQLEFAAAFGINIRTVQDWEQGRNEPAGSARNYLALIKHNPYIIMDMLRKTMPDGFPEFEPDEQQEPEPKPQDIKYSFTGFQGKGIVIKTVGDESVVLGEFGCAMYFRKNQQEQAEFERYMGRAACDYFMCLDMERAADQREAAPEEEKEE